MCSLTERFALQIRDQQFCGFRLSDAQCAASQADQGFCHFSNFPNEVKYIFEPDCCLRVFSPDSRASAGDVDALAFHDSST